MKIGAIVQAKYFNGIASEEDALRYQSLLKANFSQAGMFAFGQMPFIAKGPNTDQNYDWTNIDSLVDFGNRNGTEILYNTVINSNENSFPEWYRSLSSSQKVNALEKHVKAIIQRYKGKIKIFKLVNESFHLPEVNIYGTNESRTSLIRKIFTWAKEIYPEGRFMLNGHVPFLKEDNLRGIYIKHINELKSAGAPIDIVGIEGHLGYVPKQHELPSNEDIIISIDEIHTAANCPVHITEFDLSYDNGPVKAYPGSKIDPNQPFSSEEILYPNWFEYQATAYKHFYELCLRAGYVEDLVFWGFLDDSKIGWERPGTGFFNQDFTPKPVYHSMEKILKASLK